MKTMIATLAFLSLVAAVLLWNSGEQGTAVFMALWLPTVLSLPLVVRS